MHAQSYALDTTWRALLKDLGVSPANALRRAGLPEDLVVLATVRAYQDAGAPYTTTWFDMFRVSDGKLVEHWDTATLP